MTIVLQSAVAASLGVQQLASAFSPAFSHLRILRNLIIPMPAGCAVPTVRIDAVIVCETGVYLFEIKAWRNAFVYRKKSDEAPPRWFLRLNGCKGAREVKDPAWQGGRKATRLRALLPHDLRLQYFVLLPCEGVALEGVMPAAVITQQDLPYIARLVRNNGRTARTYPLLDAQAVDRTAQQLLDIQVSALRLARAIGPVGGARLRPDHPQRPDMRDRPEQRRQQHQEQVDARIGLQVHP